MSRHFCDESLSRVWFAYVVIYIHTCVCVCLYFIRHINFFCIWFRYFRCRAMCRKSVQSAARRAFSNWSAVRLLPTMPWCDDPNPTWTLTCRTSHSLSPPLLLFLSLSAWVDQNSCAHCIHRRPHSTHGSILQLPRMCGVCVCVHVRACACVCMVTTGSRAVNVCTSSIINKALLSLSLSLSLSTAFSINFGPFWQLCASFVLLLLCLSIDAAADKQQHVR